MSISPSAFCFVADLVLRETSMLYEAGKEYLVEARLMPVARVAGFADVESYIDKLRTDLRLRRDAIDALTINETSWFRDNAPYVAFTDVMLPNVIAARTATRRIRIWSAACSSGQEAYSLAMLLDERLPAGWTAEILATDVSTAMLERVKRGTYSQVEMNRGLPATLLVKHFSKIGSEWEVNPRLRQMVRTQHLNLAAPFTGLPAFDIIFLRNVLIYFDMDVKRDILRRVRNQVTPDGYLLLGSSETTLDLEEHWTREPAGRVQLHRPASAGITAPKTVLTGA